MKKAQQNSQIWIKKTIIGAISLIMTVLVINLINDPLWVFNHENFTNKTRLGFNERQQKTNLLYFDNKNYNSILLGNSKSTYINQNNFKQGKLFNYSVSAMDVSEYSGYINFFKEVTKQDPKHIILGIDFNFCLANKEIHSYQDPSFYINTTTSTFYNLKHLLSYNTLIYSLRNLSQSINKKKAIYYHDNSKFKIGFKKDHQDGFKPNLIKIKKEASEHNIDITYDNSSLQPLKEIKDSNKNSNFIIIFLPDFMPYFTINNNKAIYNKCLKDITQIFDKKNIFNFMKLSQSNTNPNHYYDGSHFRSYIGDDILKEISR